MKTIKYALKQEALRGLSNDPTIQQYKKNIDKFADWAKETYHLHMPTQITDAKALVQEYTDCLSRSGKSASTIHTYIAPVCKGLGLPMDEIVKPKRTADTITKTRDTQRNLRGKKDSERPKNARIVEAAEKLGLRKAELCRLTGSALGTDVTGHMCVTVKGKGGKVQRQRVLPEDEKYIKQLFKGVKNDEKIFQASEIKGVQNVSIHSLRGVQARRAYNYYAALCTTPEGRETLQNELKAFYTAYHPPASRKEKTHFDREMTGMYVLRSANRERAITQGRPVAYDKTALLAVSVLHLAHWRNDVTIKHYMM